MPSKADQDEQQTWLLQRAAADYTSFVTSTGQLALSLGPDITIDHRQPEAADIVVQQYAKQLGHALQQRTDSTVALADVKQVLDGLGLASVAWQSQEAANRSCCPCEGELRATCGCCCSGWQPVLHSSTDQW